MKQILVAIDFSENAGKALSAAKIIAKKTGAKLILLHAYQPDITDVSIPAIPNSAPIYEAIENSLKQHFEEYLIATRAEGYEVDSVWVTGRILSGVLEQAEQRNVDLIVVGRTGKGGFFDKLIGSAATGIAIDAPCPVLVIPPQSETSEFKEIVYATQLEYEEIDILSRVLALTQALGARLTFIKVSSLEQPNIQPDQQFTDQMTRELGIERHNIIVSEGGGVLDGIEKYCDEVKADLLIVSTRERDFLEKFIINPSLTKKMVVETHIPLLVHHIK